MSYTNTDVIFKWSRKDHRGYYLSNYTMNLNDEIDKIKYEYYYKDVEGNLLPIIRINTPEPSSLNYSYITNISTVDIQYKKIIKHHNVDINDILTIQEVRELKINTILS